MLTEFLTALAWCLVILAWVQGTGITLYGACFSKACEADQQLPVLLRIFFQQVLGLTAFIGVLALLAIGHEMTREALWLLFGISGLAGGVACWRRMKVNTLRVELVS